MARYGPSGKVTATSGDVFVSGQTLSVKLSAATNGSIYTAKFKLVDLAPRITWSNNRYEFATDPADAGLYFKYGSVVGVSSGHRANQVLPGTNLDAYDSGNVAYTPTGAIYSSWNK